MAGECHRRRRLQSPASRGPRFDQERLKTQLSSLRHEVILDREIALLDDRTDNYQPLGIQLASPFQSRSAALNDLCRPVIIDGGHPVGGIGQAAPSYRKNV